jgi:hypothetical protein
MLARRWRWSCVYVGANLVAFALSYLAGEPVVLWQIGLAWLLEVGYIVVLAKTRTPRGPWGSRLRSEVEHPEFWRDARSLSSRRGGTVEVHTDMLVAARRDASDWLSGVGITTFCAAFFLAAWSAAPSEMLVLGVVGGGCVVLTFWGLARAHTVMERLDRADPAMSDRGGRSRLG